MTCHKVKFGDTVGIISVADTYKIRAGGKEFIFDFHPFFGPSIRSKNDKELPFPRENSPFWDALHFWLKQGKQVDAEGWCVYKSEMKLVDITKHIGGRTYLILR